MKKFLKYYLKTFKDIVSREPIFTTIILSVFFYSIFYPIAYKSQQPESLPIVIVDEEHSSITNDIINSVYSSPQVKIIEITDNFLEAKQMIKEEKAEGILLLPENLSNSLHRGEPGGVGLYLSASNLLASKTIGVSLASAIENTMSTQLEQFQHTTAFSPQIPIHQIPLYNTLSGYGSYVFPAISSLIIHQTIVLGLCMLIAGFREKKWIPEISEFWGIFSALLTIGCLGCLYLFGFTFWLNDYPHGGNFLGMLIAVPIFVSCITAFGLLLSTFLDVAERAGHIIVMTSVPLLLLSGVAWPHQAMPQWMQWVGNVLPSTQGIQMFIQLNQMGAPISIVIPKLIYLFSFAVCCLVLAWYRLNNTQVPKS